LIVSIASLLIAGCGDPVGKSNNGNPNNTQNNGTTNNGSSNGSSNNGSSNGSSNNAGCDIATPEFHRAEHATCDDEREPGNATTNGTGDCEADADCTDGRNGRCLEDPRSLMRYCSYDACLVDDDCGGDAACECGAADTFVANACLPGNCVTDADCGETGYCSPSQGECGAYVGVIGYFCHTCEDECVTDADCGGDPYTTYCAYDPAIGHWACSDMQCAG
jgi:hypothetical protein